MTKTAQMILLGKAARVGVVAGTAILLTVCRGWMLAVTEQSTPLDAALNYFVVFIAPLCALYSLGRYVDLHFVKLIWPVGLLAVYVSLCLLFYTPKEYWPPHSPIVSILLAVLLASQISRAELKLLRYSILGLAVLFNLVVFVWNPGLLSEALSGGSHKRLGAELSPSNVLVMPRVYYTFVFTCFASVMVERRLWLRLLGVVTLVVPALLGLSSGSRGPLVALAVATLVFVVGLMIHFGKLPQPTSLRLGRKSLNSRLSRPGLGQPVSRTATTSLPRHTLYHPVRA